MAGGIYRCTEPSCTKFGKSVLQRNGAEKNQAASFKKLFKVLPASLQKYYSSHQEFEIESEDYEFYHAAARTITVHYAAYMVFVNVCKENFPIQKGLLKVGTKRGRTNRFPFYTREHRKTKLKQIGSVPRANY